MSVAETRKIGPLAIVGNGVADHETSMTLPSFASQSPSQAPATPLSITAFLAPGNPRFIVRAPPRGPPRAVHVQRYSTA
jgi:hypothetical protein